MSRATIGKFRKRDIFAFGDGTHRLDKNLYLRVRGNGRYRNYFFRYLDERGIVRDIAFGSASKTSITEVKQKTYFFRTVLAANGRDTEVQTSQRMLFKDYAVKTIELLASVKLWKNPAQKQAWLSSINTYCNPLIGEKFVDEITRNDILLILRPIWFEKTMTACRLRGRIEKIFHYAIHDHIYIGLNPATWDANLDMFLPAPTKCATRTHFNALNFESLKSYIPALKNARPVAAKALLFGVLTATRTVEFTQAMWTEINWKDKVWLCPPTRRKDGKKEPFRVPLSIDALEILKELKKESKGAFIFSVDGRSPIRRETPGKYLKKSLNAPATMHGMRSTFRDWCAENSVDNVVAEKCLMHSTGTETFLAYQRSDLLEQRRVVMQSWAEALFRSKNTDEEKADLL